MGLLSLGGVSFVNRPEFGRLPSGKRLERIMASPHYYNGQFNCLEPVTVMSETAEAKGTNRISATLEFLFGDKTGLVPPVPMVSEKTDLRSLPVQEDVAVWMGHSSFFLQVAGRRILIDPVFSSYASPVFFVNKAFPGSNVYTAEEMPEIDVLLMSHDHWDHLDYATVIALKDKIKHIVCPLGVGEYFEQWGFDMSTVHEEDWDTEVKLAEDFSVWVTPSQHFSGRFLKQNQTQWCGFAIITPGRKVYLSGDGGYGQHFKRLGEQFGGFDVAILENGQYNVQWSKIHLMPPETAQAAVDLRAKLMIPDHNGKFALARHMWDEPYKEMVKYAQGNSYRLATPEIGEAVHMADLGRENSHWWEQMV